MCATFVAIETVVVVTGVTMGTQVRWSKASAHGRWSAKYNVR